MRGSVLCAKHRCRLTPFISTAARPALVAPTGPRLPRPGADRELTPPQPLARRCSTRTRPLAATSQMDPQVEDTIGRIHSTPFKLVIYVTGGASQATSWLLSVPGASRTVLEVRVPYAASSLTQALGKAPAGACNATTSVDMAVAAYRQAASLSTFGTPILGIGATCALATDRERRGEHKAFITAHTGLTTRTYSLQLDKHGRGRQQEDALTSRLMVRAIADAMGVSADFADMQPLLQAPPSDAEQAQGSGDALQVDMRSAGRAELLRDMLNGRDRTLEFSGGGALVVDAPRPGRVYLPGSFNPLHTGHREMLAAACRLAPGIEGAFELSVGNADKGLMSAAEVERRVAQFESAGLPVVVTQAPLFTQKADLFPGSVFVVGYDTAFRLVQARYYGNETAMLLQFAKLAHQGCSFLVAGRQDAATGRFLTLQDLPVPEVLQRGQLFRGIPESEFRMDISSTELRQQGMGLRAQV